MNNDEVATLYTFLTSVANKTVVSISKKHKSLKDLTKLELFEELSNFYEEIVNHKG